MLQHLQDFKKYIEISSFRDIDFGTSENYLKSSRKQKQAVDIQLFDADLIATWEHLYFASVNALQAFRSKTNISKSIAMETMLYASAHRQIQKAIERCGIRPDSKNMAVLIIADNVTQAESALKAIAVYLGKTPNQSALEMTPQKDQKIRIAFGITEQELDTVTQDEDRVKALVSLVIEQMALLPTQV